MQKPNFKTIFSIVVLIAAVGYFTWAVAKDLDMTDDGGIHIDTMDKDQKAKQYEVAKEIVNPAGFINTEGLKIAEHIGKKVILVDFWTYSCINCQRTQPYLNSWYEKYKDAGLEIVGVHTPEFEFEKDIANVQRAVEQYGIKYPVVLDNDYATWRAYDNRYWPRKYLIDIDGFIVYDHIGEGAYDETEMKIQELLEERARALGMDETIDKNISTPIGAEEVDFTLRRSPETYFGAARNTYLAGISGKVGQQSFPEPTGIKENILYLTGDWDIQDEFAQNTSVNAKVTYRFQAQKVFIVASAEAPVRAQILVDGQPVGDIAGRDVEGGFITIQKDQLYRLVEGDAHGEHTLEIVLEAPGVKLFAFTFG